MAMTRSNEPGALGTKRIELPGLPARGLSNRSSVAFDALVFLSTLLFSMSAGAQAIHVDVTVQENVSDGRLSVHGFDWDVIPAISIVPDQRVYARGVTISGNSVLGEDPGFTSITDSTALTPVGLLAPSGNEALLFNVLSPPLSTMPALGGRTLSWWDGAGPVTWGPLEDADEGIEILKGFLCCPSESITIDDSTSDVVGFSIANASGGGFLHQHLKMLLLPDNGSLPPAGPEDGVYLMLIELSYASYAEWIPVFLGIEAFAGGRPTQVAAIDDVTAEFLNPLCSDGIDNDKDGTIDAAGDAGCIDGADMSERGATTECDNGIDDDGDGFVDFHDLDGDGTSDYAGDASCLHPTNAREFVVVPEPTVGSAATIGLLALAAFGRRGRSRRSPC